MWRGQKTALAREFRKNMTLTETVLWSRLKGKALGYKFRRQHPVGPYLVDFACVEAKLTVEVDGATHRSNEEAAYDAARTRFIEEAGWRELRVGGQAVLKETSSVIEAIRDALWEQSEAMKRQSP